MTTEFHQANLASIASANLGSTPGQMRPAAIPSDSIRLYWHQTEIIPISKSTPKMFNSCLKHHLSSQLWKNFASLNLHPKDLDPQKISDKNSSSPSLWKICASSPVPNAALNLAANVRVPPCFAPVGSASDALMERLRKGRKKTKSNWMGKVGSNTSIGQIWAEILTLSLLHCQKKWFWLVVSFRPFCWESVTKAQTAWVAPLAQFYQLLGA